MRTFVRTVKVLSLPLLLAAAAGCRSNSCGPSPCAPSPCDPSACAPSACAPAPCPCYADPVYSGGCGGDPGIGRDGTGAFAR